MHWHARRTSLQVDTVNHCYVPSLDTPRAAYMDCLLCGGDHEYPANILFVCTAETLPELRRGLLDATLSSWLHKLGRLDDAVNSKSLSHTIVERLRMVNPPLALPW